MIGFKVIKADKIKILLLCTLAAIFLVSPGETGKWAIRGARLWALSVLPSLLPFMIITGLLINTSFPQIMSGIFTKIMKPLFGMPGESSIALVTGLLCGYPMGAKSGYDIYTKGFINQQQLKRLIIFACCPGPVFVSAVIASNFLKSVVPPWYFILSNILAAILTGILLNLFQKKQPEKKEPAITVKNANIQRYGFYKVLWDSVSTILSIGAVMVFMSAVTGAVTVFTGIFLSPENFPSLGIFQGLFNGFLEITSGIDLIASENINLLGKILLVQFIACFGGISVFLQIKEILKDVKISLLGYIKGRLIFASLSTMILFMILKVSNFSVEVYNYMDIYRYPVYPSDVKITFKLILVCAALQIGSMLILIASVYLCEFISKLSEKRKKYQKATS